MKRWPRALAAVALLAGAGFAASHLLPRTAPDTLAARVASLQQPEPRNEVDCRALLDRQALHLLVLGQSNAGSHGPRAARAEGPVLVEMNGRCYRSGDPLPGTTGDGGSTWARLPPLADGRPLLLSVIGVDSTRIADWTGEGALRLHVQSRLRALAAAGMQPQLVLWQQGEADARDGTAQQDYAARLAGLRSLLAAQGVKAPLVAALSTYCPGKDGAAVRAAVKAEAAQGGLLLGPDTDQLQGDLRIGCHFSGRGLDAAAALWGARLQELVLAGLAQPRQ